MAQLTAKGYALDRPSLLTEGPQKIARGESIARGLQRAIQKEKCAMKHPRHQFLNGVVKMRYVRVALITFSAVLFAAASQAREDFGRYWSVPHDIKAWIETLTDTNGIGCCATADGLRPQAIDWDIVANHYSVKVGGGWIGVPDGAVVKGPNRLGHAVAWLEYDWDINTGEMTTRVRCFLPGPLS